MQAFGRDEREHHLARCALLQRFFPALAGNDTALRVEIEKTSSHPLAASHCWSSTARSLLLLEWLMKMLPWECNLKNINELYLNNSRLSIQKMYELGHGVEWTGPVRRTSCCLRSRHSAASATWH